MTPHFHVARGMVGAPPKGQRNFEEMLLALCMALLSRLALSRLDVPAGSVVTRIAFGSCNKPELPQPLWPAITAFKPDVFVWLGDVVYADTYIVFPWNRVPSPVSSMTNTYAMQKVRNTGRAS